MFFRRNRPAAKQSQVAEADAIRAAFDQDYYLACYPDVANAGVDPVLHYVMFGATEGRDPSPDFFTNYYLQTNPDLRHSKVNPFYHYLTVGRNEGRRARPEGSSPKGDERDVPGSADPARRATTASASASLQRGASATSRRDTGALGGWAAEVDGRYYLARYRDVAQSGENPVAHYERIGWLEGRDPTPWFSTTDYLRRYPDIADAGINPFVHFLSNGRDEGREPNSRSEDWRLLQRAFDPVHYLTKYPDIAADGVEPVRHYLETGWREGRDPTPWFSTLDYLGRHPELRKTGLNPFLHCIMQGGTQAAPPGQAPSPTAGEEIADAAEAARATVRGDAGSVAAEVRRFTSPGPDFEASDLTGYRQADARARVIAFYLPQFHSIPENDRWWGDGFTEWQNLPRGLPRFRGHYQPRVPRDLGYYDLRNPEVMRRQVELAATAGIEGFCFYYYWFNGKRLLDAPLDAFVEDRSLTFPFCLMWANENWTRRWDGLEHEVLARQDYHEEHDEALMASFARYFQSPRYIRVDDRPILIVYRPDHVPGGAARFARWRELWRDRHGVSPLLLMAQSFDNRDPRPLEFDAAIEFTPHKYWHRLPTVHRSALEPLDPESDAAVFDYKDMVENSLREARPEYPLIKTVVPSWDNDARRQGHGTIFRGSSPAQYERWLSGAIARAGAQPPDARGTVFINAWNEWAEGAYLEPDQHFGSAYLNATARAIHGQERSPGRKVLLVGHDAHRHGAQILLLHVARTLRRQFGMDVMVLLLEGGELEGDYKAVCPTLVLPPDEASRAEFVAGLREKGYAAAVTNTTVTGALAGSLHKAGIRFVSLIHEMAGLLREMRLESAVRLISEYADHVVFPSSVVRDGFTEIAGREASAVIQPQGAFNRCRPSADAARSLRARLGIPENCKIVLNAAYADLRKGFDLFVAVAREVVGRADDVHFVWLGNMAPDLSQWLLPQTRTGALADRFHHVAFARGPQDYIDTVAGADLFFLSSREDPFPSVVLDAFAAGLPILAFEGIGGFEHLTEDGGRLAPKGDVAAAAVAIEEMLALPDQPGVADRAEKRRPAVERDFSHDGYCARLVRLAAGGHRPVSVIVPNYNYARHLRARLSSIFEQTCPVFEIILLDDASTDDSLALAGAVADEFGREISVIANERNSGSVFRQWRKGLEAARGEYVWIAEADDVADPDYLATLLRLMVRSGAGFGFTDSWQIDEEDRRLGDSYAAYCDGAENGRFGADFVLPGRDFVRECLAVKNTVLNVSSVLWRRDALVDAAAATGDDLDEWRVAGDWRLYAEAALAGAPVAYRARALNGHRRHDRSVTHGLKKKRHFDEIAEMHRIVRSRLDLDEATLARMRDHRRLIAEKFGLEDTAQARELAAGAEHD